MSVELGFYGIAALLVLLALRVPVALSMIIVSLVGITVMFGWNTAIGMLSSTPYEFIAKWTLSAVPMFLLMGFVCFHTGLTSGLFNAAKVVFRWLPGGVAISSIFASSGFAAVSGSSVACAAAMGRIAIPEMVKGGYKPSFACGTIAAGGTIGALIPPSILMIVYGVFAQVSITQVFLGGISIGLLTAVSYSIVILMVSWLCPDIVPRKATDARNISAKQALIEIWPVMALGLLVFGGLFSGFFTATEAGAVGAAGAILIGLILRRLDRKVMKIALLETLSTTSALLIIGVGASMFTLFLSLSGLAGYITGAVTGWEPSYLQLMLVVVLIYLFLGLFMEPFGAMLVTLPVLLPVFELFDVSLIWFGVLLVKLLEIGMITPPVGMNIFVIKGVAGQYASLVDIFKGVTTFLIADIVVVALVIFFPEIVLFLTGS
ncbi:TRAP transporter large permease [Vreelandella venusta]|uniref:TRAP transporter large permease protein n=1 Tax=Vreelandella venusta TaxID=44935 RepID=A0AAQ0CG76_9GAMM|nr:TRAP transporter large permease [Halomonas venusta]QRL03099.1 TRAP transporter large permease [Halomonas venusta]GEK53056.1 C4-dicarboxylate ABC transporter [Halomonas venusta]